jgi:two-component system response regulator
MKSNVILLVEDNPSDEALTVRALTKAGVTNQVVVARDGAEALDYLFCTGVFTERDPSDQPSVVLMDLSLPKVGGLDAIARIRADTNTQLIPVVILTSSDEERDRLKGYATGANSFVRKPVEFNEFASAVRQIGLYWVILNELPPANKRAQDES